MSLFLYACDLSGVHAELHTRFDQRSSHDLQHLTLLQHLWAHDIASHQGQCIVHKVNSGV